MVGVIEGFRWALLGHESPPWRGLLPALVIVAIVLVTGLAYFRRVERFVADRI
jgi:lipopolysaccharide transport system permease protein